MIKKNIETQITTKTCFRKEKNVLLGSKVNQPNQIFLKSGYIGGRKSHSFKHIWLHRLATSHKRKCKQVLKCCYAQVIF